MRTLLISCILPLLAPALRADDKPPKNLLLPEQRTLVNPDCSHCKDEAKRRKDDLRPDDRVLCWVRGKYGGGAIPFRFYLNPFPVISDTYGVFVRDADAGFARGFAPSLDFRFDGWRNGVMVLRHKDGTRFSSLTGVAFEGKRKGEKLTPIPSLQSDWGWWVDHYPDTVAYHMYAKYKEVPDPKASDESRKSRGAPDPRLAAEELVLGVDAGKAKAYPLATLRKVKVLHDTIDSGRVMALYHEATRAAAAYEPTASPPKPGPAPRPLTLAPAAKGEPAAFKDKETGSFWDITGRCVAGELNGWALKWLDGVEVKWFAWSAEHPGTGVYK
jgi:hypothetical protein